jgi:hypothetical protein
MPYTAFTAPIPSVNLGPIAMPGSMHFRWGKRKPQSYSYSPYFPQLQYNGILKSFFGGNFWDSRSTGYRLGSPDAEQAQHPPVDPDEQGFPDTACIAYRFSNAEYRPLFELVWGEGSFDIKWPADTDMICSTREGNRRVQRGKRLAPTFDLFEQDDSGARRSRDAGCPRRMIEPRQTMSLTTGHKRLTRLKLEDVSAFSSKFDAFLAGTYTLTADDKPVTTCSGKGSPHQPFDAERDRAEDDQTDTSSAPGGAPCSPASAQLKKAFPGTRSYLLLRDETGRLPRHAQPAGFGFKDLGMGLS